MRTIAAFIAGLALIGADAAQAQSETQIVPSEVGRPLVYAGPCVWADVPLPYVDPAAGANQSAIFEALAGGLITQSITGIREGLESASQARVFELEAPLNLEVAEVGEIRCIQIVARQFVGSGGRARERMGSLTPDETRRLAAAGIREADAQTFFVELWLRRSVSGAHIALVPTMLIRNGSLERGGGPETDRPIEITVGFRRPADTEATEASVGPMLADIGIVRTLDQAVFVPAGCFGQQGAAPGTRQPCRLRGADSSPWIANPLDGSSVVTLFVEVQETRPRNAVLAFIAGAFDESDEELDPALRQQLLPSGRAELEGERITAVLAFATKLQELNTALNAYCTSSTVELERDRLLINLRASYDAAQLAASEAQETGRMPRVILPPDSNRYEPTCAGRPRPVAETEEE